MTEEFKRAQELKEQANDIFRTGEHDDAKRKYFAAINTINLMKDKTVKNSPETK